MRKTGASTRQLAGHTNQIRSSNVKDIATIILFALPISSIRLLICLKNIFNLNSVRKSGIYFLFLVWHIFHNFVKMTTYKKNWLKFSLRLYKMRPKCVNIEEHFDRLSVVSTKIGEVSCAYRRISASFIYK